MTLTNLQNVITKHQRMVFSIALRTIGDYGVAEEIMQDVFLALYQTEEPFESEDHQRLWLRRVCVHRSIDALRKRNRQPEISAEGWSVDGYDAAQARNTPMALEARMEHLLQALPENMRIALVLRYQEDLSPREIAQTLLQPLDSVKSNLKRGLKLLRREADSTLKEFLR